METGSSSFIPTVATRRIVTKKLIAHAILLEGSSMQYVLALRTIQLSVTNPKSTSQTKSHLDKNITQRSKDVLRHAEFERAMSVLHAEDDRIYSNLLGKYRTFVEYGCTSFERVYIVTLSIGV
jgi:hypothetical protein